MLVDMLGAGVTAVYTGAPGYALLDGVLAFPRCESLRGCLARPRWKVMGAPWRHARSPAMLCRHHAETATKRLTDVDHDGKPYQREVQRVD